MAKDPPANPGESPSADSEDPPPGGTDPEEPAEEETREKREFRWPALRRSKEDRLVAGIAGGVGDYFRIDPVIVRVAFIVLTLVAGVGPVLYLLSWLVVPLGDSGSILANALRGGAPRRSRNLAGIVLIALGLFITLLLSRNVFELFARVLSTAPYVAIALIVAGIGLVFWPRRSAPPLDTPAEPLAAPTANPVPPPPSAAGSEWPGVNPGDEPSRAQPGWRERRAERRLKRRGQSTVTFLTLAALLVLTGGAILLDRLDVERVLLGEFFAVALLVVAVGLLVSVFVGRNWLLVVLGVLLLVPLVVFSASDTSWWAGFGDVESVPEDVSSLDRDIKHGIGSLVLDLRSLDRDSLRSTERATVDQDIRLTMGEVLIKIPADLRVRTNASIGAGSLRRGEYVTVKRVNVPMIVGVASEVSEYLDILEDEDGKFYCLTTSYRYSLDEEIPDFSEEQERCGNSPYPDYGVLDFYGQLKRGVALEAQQTTHDEHDIELNVEVGVGRVRVVRYPTQPR
ncbi:MAG: PspC domain-containing protein [Acidimicrobiaceae bacterium]|nr:PspC domain-containing protein [Acidimicrobiia bacterium]MCY4495389.1 PspC domain-containing protein [Acidimicrobiaceae bacterium]